MKYSFKNDYSEAAHPSVVEALAKIATEQQAGYGEDEYSRQAANLIKKEIGNEQADIHFVSGGTQANLIVLASLLKPYQAVIAPTIAHINVHEAGAIEATGHKVLAVATEDGKLTPQQVQTVVNEHTDEHMVKPRVVFISQSTEVGTIYSQQELKALAECCKSNQLYLYVDGARIGVGVTCQSATARLADISACADALYIGGTKNGALFGEAIVINNEALKKDLRYHIKQRGGLLAKGHVIGAQFKVLFENKLYIDLAKHANDMAAQLVEGIKQQGYEFMNQPATNQIFPILPNKVIEQLEKDYGFYVWKKTDSNSSVVRLVTSWATSQEKVQEFLNDLKAVG